MDTEEYPICILVCNIESKGGGIGLEFRISVYRSLLPHVHHATGHAI